MIELLNLGTEVVELSGWALTRGVRYQFSDYSLGPQGRVVVAADVETFLSLYPDSENVVGGWEGRLSNRGETIELVDALGNVTFHNKLGSQKDRMIYKSREAIGE